MGVGLRAGGARTLHDAHLVVVVARALTWLCVVQHLQAAACGRLRVVGRMMRCGV
jgi:hypothetical protein